MDINEIIASWEADEARIRARLCPPDTELLAREKVFTFSGMELFEAMFAGEVAFAPIAQTLDFLPIHIEPGRAVFQGRPQRRHYNPLGTVHGGWFAAVLDSAVACAVHSTLPVGKGYTTLELKVNMVRALDHRTPLVRSEGRVLHRGQQVATAEAEIVGPDGKLYAHATTTCLIFDPPAAR